MPKTLKVSVIIPSRNEQFMARTVNDVLAKARGDVDVLVGLDGYWPVPVTHGDGTTHEVDWRDPRVHAVHFGAPQGMRTVINACARVATGDFLMKLDAHCMLAEGYDVALQEECDRQTVVVPRRYSLDPENWKFKETGKKPVDYHYLSWPYEADRPGVGLHGTVWTKRAHERQDILIDEEMSSQGSCWFMQRKYFNRHIGPLDTDRYGNFVQEFQEIGLKAWLGGGRVLVNKKTWYAHLHKGKEYGRGYFISKGEMARGAQAAVDYWMFDEWTQRVHDIKWLIERFWPVPHWPTNWEQLRHEARFPGGPEALKAAKREKEVVGAAP